MIGVFGTIAHIGIAVKDLKQSVQLYSNLFGVEPVHSEYVPDQQVNSAMFSFDGTSIELLESTAPGSPIAKFIEKRGEGLHHVAVKVPDLVATAQRLKESGARLLNDPRPGAGGHLYVFVHPASTGGVLLELIQE